MFFKTIFLWHTSNGEILPSLSSSLASKCWQFSFFSSSLRATHLITWTNEAGSWVSNYSKGFKINTLTYNNSREGMPIYWKDDVAHQKFSKTHLKGTKILFCGWLAWNVLLSQRGNKLLHNTLSSAIFFLLNTLKDTAKTPALNCLRLNTLRATKTALLTLKWYYKPHPFLQEFSPQGWIVLFTPWPNTRGSGF